MLDQTNNLEEAANDFGKSIEGVEEIPTKAEWVTGLELFNMQADEIPMLIGEIIPQSGLVALVGSSDTGKSMLLRQLAVNIVRDEKFLSFKINARYRSAAIVSTEDDAKALSFLLRRQTEGNPKGLEKLHVFFESENVIDEIDEKLKTNPVDIIVCDAWGDIYSGNQVDSGQIRQELNKYKALSIKHDCAIIFLHHTGKRTQKLTPSKDNILSGQGFEAKMRLVLELRNDSEDPDFRHLCVVKGNYLGKEFKNASFKIAMEEDTFLFYDTGERVSFDDLATVSNDGKEIKAQPKKASELDPITHKLILEQVFAGNLKPKLKDLQTRISAKYGDYFKTNFGGRRVDAYLDYLITDMGWIIKEGKDRSPNTYYWLGHISTTNNATEDVDS